MNKKSLIHLFVIVAVGITAASFIVSATEPQTIEEMITGKSSTEKAMIKGREIANIKTIAKQRVQFSGGDYFIEVVDMKAIPKGVEVFTRAWNVDGTQIGFGKDGTVDIERFVFINPPILIDDPNGTIIREWTDEITGELKQRKLREDPKEAILQSLSHTIYVKKQKFRDGNIILGKVGNTTLIVFPNAGTGTAPIDGDMRRDIGTSEEGIATIAQGAGNVHTDTAATIQVLLNTKTGGTTDLFNQLLRGGFGFDTSSISTDGIDSAILSIYANSKATVIGSIDMDIVSFGPASESDFVNGDYAKANFGTTLFATGKDITNDITTGIYNNYTLNSGGESHINKSGNTFFGSRLKWDIDESFTGTWVAGDNSGVIWSSADVAGTTQDPKLVVEHSIPAPVISNTQESGTTETSTTILWNTNVSSDSKVSYGTVSTTTGIYDNSVYDGTDVTSHSMSLSGLTQATTYYYVVVSTNADDETATSTEQSFTTLTPSIFLAYKNSNQSLANSTDISANEDDELVLTLATSTTYAISGTIFATSTHTLPDIKIGFATSSAGVTMDVGYVASDGTGGWIQYAKVASSKIDVPASGAGVIQISGTAKTTDASTILRLLWAQNSSNSIDTTVKSGSYIRAEEIQ